MHSSAATLALNQCGKLSFDRCARSAQCQEVETVDPDLGSQ